MFDSVVRLQFVKLQKSAVVFKYYLWVVAGGSVLDQIYFAFADCCIFSSVHKNCIFFNTITIHCDLEFEL